jgi:hypothetical protein
MATERRRHGTESCEKREIVAGPRPWDMAPKTPLL